MNDWFLELKPNEATWAHFLCRWLFESKLRTSSEVKVATVFEFTGPFMSHNLHELVRKEIKLPVVKHDPFKNASNTLQSPAEVDLRSRSDFEFGALTKFHIQDGIRDLSQDHSISGISNNFCYCAVAIAAQVKATDSSSSFTAAKSQWSSLAYLQIMERLSIKRETTYVGDENLCQYGYRICGLSIRVWKMGLQTTNRRKGEKVSNVLYFPRRIGGRVQSKESRNLKVSLPSIRKFFGGFSPKNTMCERKHEN